MSKITRKQADKLQTALDAAIIALSAQKDAINNMPITEALTETFNLLVDQIHALELQKWSVERAYTRRDWTSSDYAFAELVAQNID